ncbi:MAG TPA: glycosyltransferase [Thermodesulfobacteriota bacterium]|nr:glycosyltransferase [Thermodesulfobacteriota bacterium]
MGIELNEITIILPTRNESGNIRKFLSSVPDNIRLIVVDASEDATPEIVSATRPRFTTVIRKPGTVTEARLIGAEEAITPWLLFTDADIVFSPDYFVNMGRIPEYDLIYGPKLSLDRYRAYYRWFAYGQSLIHLLGVPAVSGSNCIIRREAYQESGGFDRELTCNEDSELAWRIDRLGYKTYYDSDLVVYAGDHRRLERGIMKKTLHSITRCTALYFDLIPARLKASDWGYWSHINTNRELQNGN